ncbi:MAG: dipeptide epimerase [Halobacteria archaeon]
MNTEELTFELHNRQLELKSEFRISRNSKEYTRNVFVEVTGGEATGYGGAAPSRYYGETPQDVEEEADGMIKTIKDCSVDISLDSGEGLDIVEERLQEEFPDVGSGTAAFSTALHDIALKKQERPLYRYLGAEPDPPPTSLTIGIKSKEEAVEKAKNALNNGFDVLKMKMGDEEDIERVSGVIKKIHDRSTVRVDANEGWSLRESLRKTEILDDLGVEFVEQPLPADAPRESHREIHDKSGVPIALDESCVTPDDVSEVADICDIVVMKLMKVGGVRRGAQFHREADKHGLEVMTGCMVESQASLSAGIHLSAFGNYADLDGTLLLADDPYSGVPYEGNEPVLNSVEKGTGVEPRG